MKETLLRNMTLDELLRFVDRSHPEVRELAERLERARSSTPSVTAPEQLPLPLTERET